MSDTTKPAEWDKLFEQAGISGQRDLASRTGASPATINRLYHGIGRPDAETVRRVADVLSSGDTDRIWKIVDTGHFDYGDFPIDKIADDLRLLTPKQRKSLLAIVKSMADPEGKGVGHVAKPAKKSGDYQGGGSVTPIKPSKPAPSTPAKRAARKTTDPRKK